MKLAHRTLLEAENPDSLRTDLSDNYGQYSVVLWVEDYFARFFPPVSELYRQDILLLLRRKSTLINELLEGSSDQRLFYKSRLDNFGAESTTVVHEINKHTDDVLEKFESMFHNLDCVISTSGCITSDWYLWVQSIDEIDRGHAFLFVNNLSFRHYFSDRAHGLIETVGAMYSHEEFQWSNRSMVYDAVCLAHMVFAIDSYFQSGLFQKASEDVFPSDSEIETIISVCDPIISSVSLTSSLPITDELDVDYLLEMLVVKSMIPGCVSKSDWNTLHFIQAKH